MISSITRLLSLVLAAGLSTSALAVEGDWGQVAQALGKSGSEMPGGVYRIGLPRTDLKVVLDGVEVKPALALGSWLAFRSEGDQAPVMGDLVLTVAQPSSAHGARYLLYACARIWRPGQARRRPARRLGLEQDALDGIERRGALPN
jgi:hypothetical protein